MRFHEIKTEEATKVLAKTMAERDAAINLVAQLLMGLVSELKVNRPRLTEQQYSEMVFAYLRQAKEDSQFQHIKVHAVKIFELLDENSLTL